MLLFAANYLSPNNRVVFSFHFIISLDRWWWPPVYVSLSFVIAQRMSVCFYLSHSSSSFLYLLLSAFSLLPRWRSKTLRAVWLAVQISAMQRQGCWMGIRGVSEWFRVYMKIFECFYVEQVLLIEPGISSRASVQRHFISFSGYNACFKSVFLLMSLTESQAVTSVVITCSLTCFYVYIPLLATHQAPGLLCWTSHPNMTGCHSNKTLLRTPSGSYIMDG